MPRVSHRPWIAALAGSALLFTATACATSTAQTGSLGPGPLLAQPILEPGQANPMIAQGVVIGAAAAIYKTSGLGPAASNSAAPSGTPESYIDARFPDGVLPPGVTVTEAQGINVLERIRENLAGQGLGLSDVVTMRVFLDNPPGTDRADYAGWNRAYRQFFANTNLETGATEPVPLGTADPAEPMVRNEARPNTRFALEVGSLPVAGWLVEVEVDAVYPEGKQPS